MALALLSFILAGILVLTRSTLRFTAQSSQVSSQTETTAAAESYLTDVLRSAKASTTSVQIRYGSDVFNCVYSTVSGAPLEQRRCFGVYSPIVDGDGDIVNFDFLVFSIEPIGDLYEDEGLSRGWDGANTLALLEYRVPLICGGTPCATPPVLADGATVEPPTLPGLIITGLSALDGGTPQQPVDFFNFDGDSTIQLRLVSRATTRDGQAFVVDREPLPLFVARRR